MVDSRNKGKEFERTIVKYLNERFPMHEFERVQSSGALAHLHKESAHLRSDIHCKTLPNLNMELKHQDAKNWSWPQMLRGGNSQIRSWLDQLLESSRMTTFDILIFKITRQGVFVCSRLKHDDSLSFEWAGSRWQVVDLDAWFDANASVFTACAD